MLAEVEFDATSVKRAEIIRTIDITAVRGIFAKNRSSFARMFDKPEA